LPRNIPKLSKPIDAKTSSRFSPTFKGGRTADGQFYVVMDYIEGLPIDRYCAEQMLSFHERIRLMIKVARAIQYAHENQVIHCDLKPTNILVTPQGDPKLLDFGVSRLLDRPTAGSEHGYTPKYASPELAIGGLIGTESDIYSFGIVLYEILTGELPDNLPEGLDTASGIAASEVVPPSERTADWATRRNLMREMDAIVLRALEKSPNRRYPGMREMVDDLEAFLAGRPVPVYGCGSAYRARKFLLRHQAALGTMALVSGLLMGNRILDSRAPEAADRSSSPPIEISDLELNSLLNGWGTLVLYYPKNGG
jgi:serine/threonine-protein kinase